MEETMMKIVTCTMVSNEWNIMKTIDGMNQDVLGNLKEVLQSTL